MMAEGLWQVSDQWRINKMIIEYMCVQVCEDEGVSICCWVNNVHSESSSWFIVLGWFPSMLLPRVAF